jgi:hypothetical protein
MEFVFRLEPRIIRAEMAIQEEERRRNVTLPCVVSAWCAVTFRDDLCNAHLEAC